MTGALLAALVGIAGASAPPPIAEGSVTTEWAPVVLVVLVDSRDAILAGCTGTYIAPGWVLTAAHCLYPGSGFAPEGAYVAFVDDWGQANGANTEAAGEWILHPDYDPNTSANDVALLPIASEPSSATASIYAGPTTQASDYGRTYTIVGFGASGWSDNSGDMVKREAGVELSKVDDTFIYTEDAQGGANGCFGDSGGPLFRVHSVTGDSAVAGVMSWVSGCEGGTMGSVRADAVIDWIEGHVPEVSVVTEMDDGPVDNPDDDAPGLVVDGQPVEPNGVGCASGRGSPVPVLAVVAAWAGLRARRAGKLARI